MKLNEAIIKVRVELQNSKIKKSGKNRFARFEYYELSDFLPKLNELMQQEGINDLFTIVDGVAKLVLIKGEERQEYCMPFVMFDVPKNKEGSDSMQAIQYLGALNTYYKRYLYLNAFGITDGEVIDAMDTASLAEQNTDMLAEQNTDMLAELKGLIAKSTNKESTTQWILSAYKVDSLESLSNEQLKHVVKLIKQKASK